MLFRSFALTLTTAALASAGLYFFSAGSSPPSTYPGSDSEHEPPRRSRDRPERPKKFIHDHITEEDTDALEDSLRQERQFLERRRSRDQRTSMRGAVGEAKPAGRSDGGMYGTGNEEASSKQWQQAQTETQQAESHWDPPNPANPFAPPPPPSAAAAAAAAAAASTATAATGGGMRDRALSDVPIPAVANPTQYLPPPRRKKTIAIVVEERKATQGHESDEDFVEAILPTVRSAIYI